MSERDELEGMLECHLSERDYSQGCTLACGYDGEDRGAHFADVILAAGYRKPRTITTAEEARELPKGTVIRSLELGWVFELDELLNDKANGYIPGEEVCAYIDHYYLPATVLYTPEETA